MLMKERSCSSLKLLTEGTVDIAFCIWCCLSQSSVLAFASFRTTCVRLAQIDSSGDRVGDLFGHGLWTESSVSGGYSSVTLASYRGEVRYSDVYECLRILITLLSVQLSGFNACALLTAP